MPKLKTHRGAAKRFKKTGTGKFMRSKAFKRHILTSKTTKREAPALAARVVVSDADAAKLAADAAVQVDSASRELRAVDARPGRFDCASLERHRKLATFALEA